MTAPIAQNQHPLPSTCDVLVKKPGHAPVRLGPFLPVIASAHASSLRLQMVSTAHPEGTTIEVAHHHDGCRHPDFTTTTPGDAWTVATMFDDEPDNAGARFPDLWARLHLAHGYEQAAALWRDACNIYDAPDVESETA